MLEKWLSKPSKSLKSWRLRGASSPWLPEQGFALHPIGARAAPWTPSKYFNIPPPSP
ncbi:hypothetical protein DPMN_001025 [Dreissena polymorpha]|uniref:Uncharacterized protein n=1 Tax=Dreissena polymorpha TaxID=45954 RepID=A0A9D4RSF2_DREPO|nr:hypothetical protein DPMN_001025 [Dreissena polymorpha]